MSMKNITIKNCGGIGMSVPNGFSRSVDIDGLEISNCAGGGFVERDRPSLLATLGLPAETPYPALLDALSKLSAYKNESSEKKTEVVRSSLLGPFLKTAADASSVVKNIVDISSSPQLQKLIAMITDSIGS